MTEYTTHAAQAAHDAAWTRDTYDRARANEVLNDFDSHLTIVRQIANRTRSAGHHTYTSADIAERFRRCCDHAADRLQRAGTP